MGDISEQIINGECCEICMFPVDTPVGCSFTCSSCEDTDDKIPMATWDVQVPLGYIKATTKHLKDLLNSPDKKEKNNCKICNKPVKKGGLKDHMRVKHNQ